MQVAMGRSFARLVATAGSDGGVGHALERMAAAAAGRPRTEFWRSLLRVAPDLPVCHRRLAVALREAGGLEQANEVIEIAAGLFPRDLGTALEAARTAELRGEPAVACGHWQRAIEVARTPSAEWPKNATAALIKLGRYDEAEAMLRQAFARHGRHADLLVAECLLAAGREDWPKAVRLSREFKRRFPKHRDAWLVAGNVAEGASLNDLARSSEATYAAPADVGRVEDDETCKLLLGFVGLGENCEFGLVQRRFAAEPLDLLRWNIVWPDFLIEALEAGLDGVGEPENTELELLANGEFFVADRRWYLGKHTFVFAGQTTHDALFPKVCQRIALQRARLVADLAAAQRICVFSSSAGLERETLVALHRALQRLGPAKLLAVQPAAPEPPAAFRGAPGDLLTVAPGLYVGFLRRSGLAEDGSWNIAFADWISVCRKAEAAARAPSGDGAPARVAAAPASHPAR